MTAPCRPSTRFALAASGALLTTTLALTATAAPDEPFASPAAVIATYCSDADLECTTAPLSYAKTISLPIAVDWDTGFIPSGSDLQVRLYFKIPASTTVELEGNLDTTWPQAMTLATPGGGRGFLKFEYGLELGAQGKIDLTVLGVGIKWTGDIPFVPKVNFKIAGEKDFFAWAFEPNGESASGISPKVRLFDVNLLGMAGIPSQISKGGVALDVAGELEATYQTERIRIETAQTGDLDITSEGQEVNRAFAGGAFVEYDVWPEGRVDYVGTLHLIPSLFVEVLGKDFTMPLIDIPVSLDIGKQDFIFDPVRVHVPLPDFEPVPETLEFGAVEVGKSKSLAVVLKNTGEAKGRATAFVDTKLAQVFSSNPPEALVLSKKEEAVELVFKPAQKGVVETTLTFVTTDPDERFLKIKLRGTGVGVGEAPPTPGTGPNKNGESGDSGGCGCRVPSAPVAPHGAWALSLLAAAALVRRRRALSD